MTGAEIRKIIDSHPEYRFFGVRRGKAKKVGQYCALSWDGYLLETIGKKERLNGTCAIMIDTFYDEDEDIEKKVEKNKAYPGEMQYIVAGENMEYGDDEDEIIINNNDMNGRHGARVIEIIG